MDLNDDGGAAGAASEGGEGVGAGAAADLLGGGAEGGDAGGAGDAGASGENGGGEGGASEGGAGEAGADPDWYGQLSSDVGEGESASLLDWVKSSGVKDLNGLAKVARDNQVALRESGRIKVPGEDASDADRAEFNKAIGVPDKPDGYEFKAPVDGEGKPITDSDGNPVQLDEATLSRISGKAHELGVPKAALEGIVQDFISGQLEAVASNDADLKAKADKWVKDQGGEAENKLAAVDNAAKALGINRSEMIGLRNAWGPERALEVMSKLGAGIREDVLVDGGGSQRFGQSAAEAQQALDAMKADPKVADKVRIKGSPENLRWNRAMAVIAAEEDRKQQQQA